MQQAKKQCNSIPSTNVPRSATALNRSFFWVADAVTPGIRAHGPMMVTSLCHRGGALALHSPPTLRNTASLRMLRLRRQQA